jgi:SpoVK/Ycf46/Vps4 family AAA+-type ATPase
MSETPKLDRLLVTVKESIGKPQSETGIEDPSGLASALIDLRELIGNTRLKEEVASQVNHLIVDQKRGASEPGMLNVLLSGPPGVGKTTISRTLARIYISLGYLKVNSNNSEKIEGGDYRPGYSQQQYMLSTEALYMSVLVSGLFWGFLSVACSIPFWIFIGGLLLTVALLYYLFKPTPSYLSEYLYGNSSAAKREPATKMSAKKVREQIKSVGRKDFVAEYLGQTAIKTEKLLQASRGKVLFVDEAYSLYKGDRDMYGQEAIDTLCQFMTDYPGEIIVVFAGYEEMIADTVFAYNPGLYRRFMWKFNCNGYSPEELFRMFKMKLEDDKWKMEDSDKIQSMFRENHEAFPSYGGDVDSLINFAKMAHDDEYISEAQNKGDGRTIKPKHVSIGISRLLKNQTSRSSKQGKSDLESLMNQIQDKLLS